MVGYSWQVKDGRTKTGFGLTILTLKKMDKHEHEQNRRVRVHTIQQ